jgi:hypothetical protein
MLGMLHHRVEYSQEQSNGATADAASDFDQLIRTAAGLHRGWSEPGIRFAEEGLYVDGPRSHGDRKILRRRVTAQPASESGREMRAGC